MGLTSSRGRLGAACVAFVGCLACVACSKSTPAGGGESESGASSASGATTSPSPSASFAVLREIPIERRATAAASQVDVRDCKTKNEPSGPGRIGITFAPSGEVTAAEVAPPFAGTTTGTCITAKFKKVRLPKFVGEPVRIGSEFVVP